MKNYSVKWTAIIFTVLAVISSIIHGVFEILQGNTSISIGRIEAIGTAHRFWKHGGEPALTIIPNFLITGIVGIIINFNLLLWVFTSIQKKNNTLLIIFFTIAILLSGGGFAPPTYLLLSIAAVIFLNKPKKQIKSNSVHIVSQILANNWLTLLLLECFLYIVAIIGGVTGLPFTLFFSLEKSIQILRYYGLIITFVFGPLLLYAAILRDRIVFENEKS